MHAVDKLKSEWKIPKMKNLLSYIDAKIINFELPFRNTLSLFFVSSEPDFFDPRPPIHGNRNMRISNEAFHKVGI